MNNSNKSNLRALLFDLEGVLVFGKDLERLPGACEALEFCRENSLHFSIVTNATTQTPETLFRMLHDRGLSFQEQQLQTPLSLLSTKLKQFKTCLVLGNENLCDFVAGHGVEVSQESEVELVLCGGGRKMEDLPITLATEAIIEHGASLITLHRNRLFTNAQGKRQLDIGALVAALEYSTGIKAQNLGKPSKAYFETATKSWGIPNEQILLVSDDPFTDLEGAKKLGFQTAFIHTGKYQLDILPELDVPPDYILKNLLELPSVKFPIM